MDFLQTVLAAIVTLGILVTIHEYGHFWVARRCGVQVLRFSVGFGKALYRWHDRQGTEYVIASIPLGGYVKMLDEREGDVPEAMLHRSFNRKPVSQRIAIVAAGPVVNLLFAVVAYWCMYVSGISTVVPVVGGVVAESAAELAGLGRGEEILSIDGRETPAWDEVNLKLAGRIGDSGEIVMVTQTIDSAHRQQYRIPIQNWQTDEERGPIFSLGLIPFRPALEPVIGRLVEEGRAVKAGLMAGDHIIRVDGEPVPDWASLVTTIQRSPEQPLLLTVSRDGLERQVQVTPASRLSDTGVSQGYIGAGVQIPAWPESMLREIRYDPLSAIGAAVQKTYQMITLTLESIVKMVQGAISVKNLSGPITIAKVAGASAESGLESFLNFLAYLSISLGVLNLLPIPMLDGGHLLYYFVEAVRGRPVSEQVQVFGLKLGMALLMSLMFLALYNDLARL